jgi:hypothetical protein
MLYVLFVKNNFYICYKFIALNFTDNVNMKHFMSSVYPVILHSQNTLFLKMATLKNFNSILMH